MEVSTEEHNEKITFYGWQIHQRFFSPLLQFQDEKSRAQEIKVRHCVPPVVRDLSICDLGICHLAD